MATQPNTKLKPANQAEIMRAYQKDNDFISDMNEKISDLLHRYKLYRQFACYMTPGTLAKILYFALTSGIGNQTLGEEYTGIVQANLSKKKVPSLMIRVSAAVLECFGERMLLKLIENLQITINKPSCNLKSDVKISLNKFLSMVHCILPILIMFHRGLFYIFGSYYSIGRRITGIDYAKVYGARSHSNINWGLVPLGFIIIARSMLHLWQTKNNKKEILEENEEVESSCSIQCQLCLEKVPNTATPCGHLFCWVCLTEWLRVRNRCPTCREIVVPSRIVPLMNL